jgi:hypothetical protein
VGVSEADYSKMYVDMPAGFVTEVPSHVQQYPCYGHGWTANTMGVGGSLPLQPVELGADRDAAELDAGPRR